MDAHATLGEWLAQDRWRMGVLRLVCDLDLPDGFVTGGFVRNLVWDQLHDRPMTPLNNVDVIYFDPERTNAAIDQSLNQELMLRSPKKNWSVSNVARWNPAATSIEEAVCRGPETASAVAISVDHRDRLTVVDPFGLTDLFDGLIRPVEPQLSDRVRARAEQKRWLKLYPRLRFAP